jgi:hypothetical protein
MSPLSITDAAYEAALVERGLEGVVNHVMRSDSLLGAVDAFSLTFGTHDIQMVKFASSFEKQVPFCFLCGVARSGEEMHGTSLRCAAQRWRLPVRAEMRLSRRWAPCP